MQQIGKEVWKVNGHLGENESQKIAALNEIFGNVELTAEERRTLAWLAGWEDGTVANVLSAIRKAVAAQTRRPERPSRPQDGKSPRQGAKPACR